jgi:hypothetical protein
MRGAHDLRFILEPCPKSTILRGPALALCFDKDRSARGLAAPDGLLVSPTTGAYDQVL